MARLKGAGWYEHRVYGKTWQRGPDQSPQPGTTDMRVVYWQEDPIETRVVRSGPHPGTTGDIEPHVVQTDYGGGKPSIQMIRAHVDLIYDGRQYCEGELFPVKLGWNTKGRHAGFRRRDPIDDYLDDLVAQPPTGGCAVCGTDVYGPERICDECCREGRGA